MRRGGVTESAALESGELEGTGGRLGRELEGREGGRGAGATHVRLGQ